jgi:hypothetical protein
MEPQILAALITAAIALVVLLFQHGFYASRLARQREKHEYYLEDLKRTNAEKLADRARLGDETAALREARRLSLERLWSAISIAIVAADSMVTNSSTKDIDVLVDQTAKFIRELTPLLNEVRSATYNVALTKADVQSAIEVRNDAVRLFLALDLDCGPNSDYEERLADHKSSMIRNSMSFKTLVERSRLSDELRQNLQPKGISPQQESIFHSPTLKDEPDQQQSNQDPHRNFDSRTP